MIQTITSDRKEVVPNAKIIELRALLAEKFPSTAAASPACSRLATGVKALDGILGGGLLRAALTEIVCPAHGTGSGTIIHAVLEEAYAARKPLALVDASDSFDADGTANEQLGALLWVRCGGLATGHSRRRPALCVTATSRWS